MAERSTTSNSYRFGFNGKEDDGETRTQDYGFRINNPSLGRFLSIDPLKESYPWYTPYQFAGNSPVANIDIDGLEPGFYGMLWAMRQGETKLRVEAAKGDKTAASTVNGLNKFTLYQAGFTMTATGAAIATPIFYRLGSAALPWLMSPQGQYAAWEATSFVANVVNEGPDDVMPTPGIGGELGIGLKTVFKTIFNTNGIPIAQSAKTSLKIIARNASLWGGNDINLIANTTTTVLGRWSKGVEFVHASGQFTQGQNVGGINILNISQDLYKKAIDKGGDQLFWDLYNKPWLDDAIKRGDAIRLVSDPYNARNLYNTDAAGNLTENLTMFGREVKHLESQGYTFNNGIATKTAQ
ncbi:MAG: hypothetical protein M0D57_00145 [Sphingobacteriales bacterium JAD_PAG50586_3]|nr:MAG: hypothetical protein M0D57_00145 [Sphingobacteriales bacterium JAD_PAG50586_3]